MIILPTTPGPKVAEPYFKDMGGWQEPTVGGGDAVRIDHLGDRHGITVQLPPMKFDDTAGTKHGRVWISRLKRGMSEGVRLQFIQPDYVPPINAANLGAAAAQATLIPVTGATPNKLIPEGIGCTIIKAATGRRYFHTVNTDANTGASGSFNLSVHPRTRVSLVVGDTIVFSPLEIEGRLIGNEQRWTLDDARTVGLQFQIEEIA